MCVKFQLSISNNPKPSPLTFPWRR